jgi:hypothetical protein
MNPLEQVALWWGRKFRSGVLMFAVGMTVVGVGAVDYTPAAVTTQAVTRTRTTVQTHTRLVTLRVRGRVIRRHDHILVVLVPRTVFRTHGTPRRRIVIPRHVVRIHQPPPVFGVTSAVSVLGVAPPPETVTVPFTVTVPLVVPGPTTTVTETQPVPFPVPTTVTVTVTVPGGFSG